MRLKLTSGFRNKLQHQVEYIAQDKPAAARRFKNDLLKEIRKIPSLPYGNRKSIFFDDEDIRDMIFKGYITVYKVWTDQDEIVVFGFTKYQDNPFKKD
jgi:plasmid stabilization system protein ParE